MLISEVIQYIKDLGFEEVPCRLPKDELQYLKRNIFNSIYDRFPKIYYFLNRISPIKFKKVRTDWSLWFKIEGGELELKPIKGHYKDRVGSYGYDTYVGEIIDPNDEKIQSSDIRFIYRFTYGPYLEQVKDMKDWEIRYISSVRYNSSVGYSSNGGVIPFGIDTEDKKDEINFWSIFDPIEHIERNLNVYPELQGPIKSYRRNKNLEQLL